MRGISNENQSHSTAVLRQKSPPPSTNHRASLGRPERATHRLSGYLTNRFQSMTQSNRYPRLLSEAFLSSACDSRLQTGRISSRHLTPSTVILSTRKLRKLIIVKLARQSSPWTKNMTRSRAVMIGPLLSCSPWTKAQMSRRWMKRSWQTHLITRVPRNWWLLPAQTEF